jgi:hypothetical protein
MYLQNKAYSNKPVKRLHYMKYGSCGDGFSFHPDTSGEIDAPDRATLDASIDGFDLNQDGEGFFDGLAKGAKNIAKGAKRLNNKYGKTMKQLGVTDKIMKKAKGKAKKMLPKFSSKLKSKGIPSNIVDKLVDEANKQIGDGFFDDMVSVLSVLPIPIVSDIARVVAITKTVVDTATGNDSPAFGGVVSELMSPLEGTPLEPLKGMAEMQGFGMHGSGMEEELLLDGGLNLFNVMETGFNHIKDQFKNVLDSGVVPPAIAKPLKDVINKVPKMIKKGADAISNDINKSKGDGLKRAGDGLKGGDFTTQTLSRLIGNISREGLKKGRGLKRAGNGLVQAGVGDKLKEEMINKYCK